MSPQWPNITAADRWAENVVDMFDYFPDVPDRESDQNGFHYLPVAEVVAAIDDACEFDEPFDVSRLYDDVRHEFTLLRCIAQRTRDDGAVVRCRKAALFDSNFCHSHDHGYVRLQYQRVRDVIRWQRSFTYLADE